VLVISARRVVSHHRGPGEVRSPSRDTSVTSTSARRVAVALFGLVLLAVVGASPAQAHATLLFAGPPIGGAVPTAPASLTLVFDEPVTLAGLPARLSDGDARPVALGAPQLTSRARVVTIPVTGDAAHGLFTVRWQVVAADGDLVGGSYRFVVGPSLAQALTGQVDQGPSSPALLAQSVLRWLLFAALSLGLGGLVGARLSERRPAPGLPAPAPLIQVAAGTGLLASTGLALLIAGNGGLPPAAPIASLSVLAGGLAGQLAIVEVAAFAVALVVTTARGRWWAGAPLLVVVAAEAARAHPDQVVPWWGGLLTGVHLLAAAVWVGALVQVIRTAVAWRTARRHAWAVLGSYARLAAWLFAVVLGTGTVSALLLVPWEAWTRTGYGRLLLVKVALVAVAAVLALLARRRLRAARVGRSVPVPLFPATLFPVAPGWAARVEAGVMAAVLAATAVLVSLPTPRALAGNGPLPLPPPPNGLAVPLGARAGQVGVSATASLGQLVVHLSAPELGNLIDGVDSNRYQLAGEVIVPGRRPLTLVWRGCGPGCFVATAHWFSGVNQLSLAVGAARWAGGSVSLALPWPVQPGDRELRRTAAVMRRVGRLTVYERVTSDPRTGDLGVLNPVLMSGKAFLGVEPYGSGAATQAVVTVRGQGLRTILVGFPGENTQAELTVTDRGRIVRETLTAPNHLVTRAFVYPSD
jgi:copper transport protein